WLKPTSVTPLIPERLGVLVHDKLVEIEPGDVPELLAALQDAVERGMPSIEYKGQTIPAHPNTLEAIGQLQAVTKPSPEPARSSESIDDPAHAQGSRIVLRILDNLETVQYETLQRRHRPGQTSRPQRLRTQLKLHQEIGLEWLQAHWKRGSPGALLADDMGLGKTLQALAFAAWVQEEMDAGYVRQAPVLIVAPTGLIKNWEDEHNRHLCDGGLGVLVQAHGPGLKRYRSREAPQHGAELASGAPVL